MITQDNVIDDLLNVGVKIKYVALLNVALDKKFNKDPKDIQKWYIRDLKHISLTDD